MKFLSARKVFGIIFAFAALGMVAPVYAQTGGVQGKAIQQDGKPCVKCIVLVDRQDIKGSYKTKTNKKGEFVYIGLPIGNYKITLQSPTGQTLYYIEKHIGLGEPTEINFDLPKEMAQQKQRRQEEIKENPELAKQAAERAKEEMQYKGLKHYFDQGNALYSQGQYKEAAAAFQEALKSAKDKNIPTVLARLADSYSKAKEDDQAIAT
jgi:tetratricopeptide (TPR) repeat protein